MKLFRSIVCEIDLSGEIPDEDTTMRKWKATKHLAGKKRYTTSATKQLAALQKSMKIKPHGSKGTGFENPLYMSGGINQWAGHPEQFTKWTKVFGQQYADLKSILQQYGVPTFDKMYYVDKPWRSGRKKSIGGAPNTLARNFILIADDGRFVWRRYDSGSDYGAAQNWIYIDGEKKYTTDILSGDKRKVKAMMKPLARVAVPSDNPIDAAFHNEK